MCLSQYSCLEYALRTLRVSDIENIEGTQCIPYDCMKHYFKAAPTQMAVYIHQTHVDGVQEPVREWKLQKIQHNILLL